MQPAAASYIGVSTDDKLSRRPKTSVTLPAQLKEKGGESLLIGSKAVRQSGVWSHPPFLCGTLGNKLMSTTSHKRDMVFASAKQLSNPRRHLFLRTALLSLDVYCLYDNSI